MTNFEKWKDEILKITHDDYKVAVKDGVPKPCVGICNRCEFEGGSPCVANFVDWLLAEYQEPAPKLTKKEREFIECFAHPAYEKICRKNYGLYVISSYTGDSLSISDNMFPFIKPGETWTFEKLMELEVEDEQVQSRR